MKVSTKAGIIFLILCLIEIFTFKNIKAEEFSIPFQRVLFDHSIRSEGIESSEALIPLVEGGMSLFHESDATVTTIKNSGPDSNRVHLVFLADGYASSEQSEFNNRVFAATQKFFLQSPLYEYQDYFNVHRVNIISKDSGITNYPLPGTVRKTALGSYLYCQGSPDTLCTDVGKAWSYAAKSPGYDQIVVLANAKTNAASAYPFSSLAVIAEGNAKLGDSLLHQVGHSFANLADEHSEGKWPVYTGFEPAEPNISAQNSVSMITKGLKWHKWLGSGNGEALIDTYEGGLGHAEKIYRPSLTSKMRDLDKPFNSPSIEAFIKEIYRRVKLIDDATPQVEGLSGSNTFYIKHPKPVNSALSIQWYLNDIPVPGAVHSSFKPNNYQLANGHYSLKVKIKDMTELVRDEEFRSEYMIDQRTWSVVINQQAPVIVEEPKDLIRYVGESALFSVKAVGEDIIYQWYKNGLMMPGQTDSSYLVSPVTRADSDSEYSLEVRNIAGTIISSPAKLKVLNRVPVVSSISDQVMYRNENRTLNFQASDPDGDFLSYSVSIEEISGSHGATARVVNQNTLEISNGSSFIGEYRVRYEISDSFESVSRSFKVKVVNRAPVIQAVPTINRRPGLEPFTVPLVYSDPDGDSLTLGASLLSPNAKIVVSVKDGSVNITPDKTYIGSFGVRVTLHDGYESTQMIFYVSMTNAAPTISVIPFQYMHWREGTKRIPIIASDPDGDVLSYSPSLVTLTDAISLEMDGSVLVVKPRQNYFGTFHAKVIVSDGFASAERTFSMNVGNQAPVIGAISEQAVHWRKNEHTLVIPATDPDPQDSGNISCSASLLAPTPGVTLSVENCVLKILLQNSGERIFGVRVHASDGNRNATPKDFNVRVYNSAPVISPIPDQEAGREVREHKVSVSASDPDGDELEYAVNIVSGGGSGISASMKDESIIISINEGYLGSARIRASVSDGLKTASTEFDFSVSNYPPVLENPGDQHLHWIKDRNKSLALSATDPDNSIENLNFLAEIDGHRPDGAAVAIRGQTLDITLPEKYLGSFSVKLSVSDGEFSDTAIFTVHSGNAPPELVQPCDISIRSDEMPYDVDLQGNDPDDEELEYSIRIEHYSLPYELNAKYNFTITDSGLFYNLSGNKEKYLKGILPGSNASALFAITPEGNLYEWKGSLEKSSIIAKLPEAYYRDPSLLSKVSAPIGPVPVSFEVKDSTVIFSADEEFLRTFIVHARVRDGQTFDEKSFLFSVYGESIAIESSGIIKMHWREELGNLELSGNSERAGDPQYEVEFADSEFAYQLYIEHGFRNTLPRNAYRADNSSGRGEKYFTGNRNTNNSYLYAILPTGEIFQCHGSVGSASIDNSTYLGKLSAAFYRFPDYIYRIPPGGKSSAKVSISGSVLSVVPDKGFTGVAVLRVSASKGNSKDTTDVILDVYNNAPKVNDIGGQQADSLPHHVVGWKTGEVLITSEAIDSDSFDVPHLSGSIVEGTLKFYLDSLKAHGFIVDPYNLQYNRDGYREKHFSVIDDGVRKEAAILPSGGIYIWNGTVLNSKLLLRLPLAYFENPGLLNTLGGQGSVSDYIPVGASAYIDDGVINVRAPDNFTGTISFLVSYTDEDAISFAEFKLSLVNNPPYIRSLPAINRHMRAPPTLIAHGAIDPDGDELQFFVEKRAVNGPVSPVALDVNKNHISISNDPLFMGNLNVYFSASDGISTRSQEFPVTIYNRKPVLSAINNKTVGWEYSVVEFPVSYSDPDDEDRASLQVNAHAGTVRHRVYELYKEYGFKTSSYPANSLGLSEKYVEGKKNGSTLLFAILPGGGLHEVENGVLRRPTVAHLPEEYYLNQNLLFNVSAPEELPPMSVTLIDNKVSVRLVKSHFSGTVPVTVSVSDGFESAFETVQVSFVNSPPTLQPIANRVFHWRGIVPEIPVNASDVNGDSLSITAINVGGLPIQVSVVGSSIRVTPGKNQVGTSLVRVFVSDGVHVVSSDFSVTFTNKAPQISPISTVEVGWKEVITRNISANDPDNDPITISAAPALESASLINVFLTGSTFRVEPKVPFNGSARVLVKASDGPSTTEAYFTVVYSNRTPVLSIIPDHSVHWRTENYFVPVSANDSDGDTLSFSAVQVAGELMAASHTISKEGLGFVFNNENIRPGDYQWQVTASDGNKEASRTFQLKITNNKPRISEIPAYNLQKGILLIEVPIEAEDPDGDPLLFSSEILSSRDVGFELNTRYEFYQLSSDHDFNKLGNNEKYFYGKDPVSNARKTFVLYPDGRLFQWEGQLTKSMFIGTISKDYYEDLSLLFYAASRDGNNAGGQSFISGNKVKLELPANFTGSMWIKVTASDTKESVSTYFPVNVYDSTFGDDSDHDDYLSCKFVSRVYEGEFSADGTRSFVSEGRIGDTVTGAGNRTFELAVSSSTAGPFNAGETLNYVWKNDVWVDFRIGVSYEKKEAIFTLDGKEVVHHGVFDKNITDIVIRSRATPEGTAIDFKNIQVGSETISSVLSSSPETGGIKTMHIAAGGLLNKSFEIKGKVKMRFSSAVSSQPRNSELAFQVSFISSAKEPVSCENGGGANKVTICHIPPGNPSNMRTIRVGAPALEAHLAHGDILGECPGSPDDPGDGTRTCEEKQLFSSPNYTLWNSFLGMINILELTNSSANDINVNVEFYSIQGLLEYQANVRVPANNQFDLIVNEFPGFIADSYGVIKLEFEGPLDGRMMYYRPRAASFGVDYDYAYGVPLADATFGTSAVGFNTYQPSLKPGEENNLVANWLSIVNLDPRAQRYLIFTYDASGTLIMRREVEVPSFGRSDIDGGHDVAGPGVVGYHKIVPRNVTAQYIAQITRFGGNAPAGFAPSEFKFALPLIARLGQSDPIFLPISRKFGETNWIEVVNILDQPVGATINYYASDGRVLESVEALIPANAQLHFHASSHLQEGGSGFAMIVPREHFSLVAQSMGYLRESQGGSVTSVYGSQARRAVPCVQTGSYNLYLGMQNWLLVGNPTNEVVQATLRLTGPSMITDKVISLSPKSSQLIPIHDNATYNTAPDTYGLLAVYPKVESVRLFTEVIRVRYRADGTPDFSVPIPVR
ncbi:MAG TPA: Ig-like domain-containing protein [Oligoflexia bacterium]|nr:Ig-like domain-containing protein [Oligoflexia bacterium]HMP47323.1 Ig-like domain-containing protein [Oligoflexia bacterium]